MIDVTHIVSGSSYLGAILAAMFANLFPGIPEEIFLLGLGYLAGSSTVAFVELSFFLLIGFFVIDTCIYWLASRGNRVIHFMGKKLLGSWFTQDSEFIQRHMVRIVFGSRFVPIIRFIGPFLAGVYRFPYQRFVVIDVIALSIYVPALLGLGIYFEDRISRIVAGVGVVQNAIFLGLVLIVLGGAAWRFRRHFIARYSGESVRNRMVLGIQWIRDKMNTEITPRIVSEEGEEDTKSI